MRKYTKAPQIIACLVCLIAVVGFFLPYISMPDEYSSFIEANQVFGNPDTPYEFSDLTYEDLKDISLFEFSKLAYQGRYEGSSDGTNGILISGIYSLTGVLGLLGFLWAAGKRATPLVITSLLMGGAIALVNWAAEYDGLMSNPEMSWGISHSLYYPCAAILFVCGIWLFAAKRKTKKEARVA